MTKLLTPKSVWKNPVHFAAFGFGSGASPVAPGTMGTVAAVLPYLWFQHFDVLTYAVMLVVTFVIGVWLCDKTSKDIGVKDHGGIVWDEFVGFWITMIAAPPGWLWIGVGFVLFRLFDILKPWPIAWADKKVAGGLGVMLDDVLAGIMAFSVLQLIVYVVGVSV